MKCYHYLLLFMLASLFQACPPVPCDPIIVEYEPLQDSIMALVPYQDGDLIQMQHSGGHVIEFNVRRELKERRSCFDCDNCIEYQQLTVDLNPDYQITPINITLRASGDLTYDLCFWFSNSSFFLSLNYPFEIFRETINTGKQIYKDTYVIVNNDSNHIYGVSSNLYADSLFYDHTYGIIKISMSNGESYMLYEE